MSDILIGKAEEPVFLRLDRANRHGVIAGATGTGKTITLQILAEAFSAAGVPVFAADVSQAISRNPVFAFKVKGAKSGDKITITWTDNKGDKRTDEVAIGAG